MNSFGRGLVLLLVSVTLIQTTPADDGRLASQQRLSVEHLSATHQARLDFARQRQAVPSQGVYQDYRAVIHVHAEDSNHTKGTRAEVLAAAKKTGVSIVMLTDHGGPKPETWRGLKDGVLFIAGEENGGAGLLRLPAVSEAKEDGELRFLSHIEERYDALIDGLAGMEICNRHSDAILDKGTEDVLRAAVADPAAWQKLTNAFFSFPDELFAAGTDYHARIFEKWDQETARHPFTGIAANDSHQNQIFQKVTFDPYEVSFRNLSTHILARALTDREVREALRKGHAYVAHDWLSDPTGFTFEAINNLGVFAMGDPVLTTGRTRLVGLTPLPAHLKLIHEGKLVHETTGTNLTFTTTDPGAYRLEAWLRIDGEERPWIYSNPVYLRAPTLADLNLPSLALDPSVEARKDIAYTSDPAVDDQKQRLDIYYPKASGQLRPVFFFIHGGAWRTGDRSQYGPLGNRFAKEGIVTVVPGYRLAPKYPHPAQIEDAAAAFAWTLAHISEYGGDTNRIFVGGHSAGGHLAALLSLEPRYLQAHHVSVDAIRGVMSLSGVFDLTVTEGLSQVFGRDPEVRRDASPLFHVHKIAQPCLVSYCEWDYPSLPTQARQFHSALLAAGVQTELLFVPRENHISEMINVPRDDDVTSQAIVRFIRDNGPN